MSLVIILLIVVIVLQVAILFSIKKSKDVQIAVTSAVGIKVGDGLDWIDTELSNSLERYRCYGD